MGPEAKLEQKLRNAITAAGGLAVKLGSPAGIPDRLIIVPQERVTVVPTEGGKPHKEITVIPRFVFVEMKTSRGRVSRIQQQRIAQLAALGCDVRVIRGPEQTESFCREIHENER